MIAVDHTCSPEFQPVPTTPSQTPWEHPPSSAEIRIVEELYAVGEGAPIIRQQVLGVRLSLDVAEQLEDMGIYDASTMTSADVRRLTDFAQEQLRKEEASQATAAAAAAESEKAEEDADGDGEDSLKVFPLFHFSGQAEMVCLSIQRSSSDRREEQARNRQLQAPPPCSL